MSFTPDRFTRHLKGVCSLGFAVALLMLAARPAGAQTALDAFHWVDFHDQKDAAIVQWVTTSLKAEKWTAIREIGVQWDSALVLTAERKTPQSSPQADAYTVWSVSLSKHESQPLFHAVNPKVLGWTTFGGEFVPELGLVYDDCSGCDASTFFTTLYYNVAAHAWRARWLRGDQAAPLWAAGNIDGVTRTQIYGLLTEPPGRNVLATWVHFDYGKTKPAEDFVYQYSVDPASGLEQMQALGPDHAGQMERELCKANPGQADPALATLARGQDSDLCAVFLGGVAKTGRRPTTTPPANNRGRSEPPGAKK
ncbi:hypothetical protein [Acidicapsa ligni]|uniref:hypothetical protein n=1 Tax=Acidicapsa ligni TaxID=542300 RepID=UPI0021DFB7B2|nr:hypothetical protein [Acidicapsa ligni]